MKKLLTTLSCILLISTYADNPEDISVMAVSPERGSVVVRYADDSQKLVSIGEDIPDTDLKLIQVLESRIIAEYNDAEKNNHQDIDQVWIFKAELGAKTSKVEYLRNYQTDDQSDKIENTVESIILNVTPEKETQE